MAQILVILVWWAGLAVIVIAAVLLASRARAVSAGVPPTVSPETLPADGYTGPTDDYTGPPSAQSGAPAVLRSVARFLVIVVAGTAVVYGVMALLGLIVVHGGPAVDKPIFHWVTGHRTHLWKLAMTRATKIGDTWTARAAAVTAAVCLAVTWRRMRWLPPVALASLMVVHRLVTHAIHLTDPRIGPPGHVHGTFPSGGSERAIVFYGLIAYLLWREFSGSRQAAIWAGAVVAALGFSEGYSRDYLGMHWSTDVLSGWIYGCLLLAVFITAVRLVAGPARGRAAAREPAREQPSRTPAWEGPR